MKDRRKNRKKASKVEDEYWRLSEGNKRKEKSKQRKQDKIHKHDSIKNTRKRFSGDTREIKSQ